MVVIWIDFVPELTRFADRLDVLWMPGRGESKVTSRLLV